MVRNKIVGNIERRFKTIMKHIIIQSSCLFFCHPAENLSGAGDYMKVIIEDPETKKREIIFTGDKWNEDDFLKKKGKSNKAMQPTGFPGV